MSRLNEAYFTAGALQAARGAVDHRNDAWPDPNGGIVMPSRVHLRTGQRYFRFADSTKPTNAQRYGSWWIEFETLVKIARFAREHSDPREAVRYFLAVPWAWNTVDKLVHGILEAPLDAYRGEGRAVRTAVAGHARDRGTLYIAPQHIKEIHQLYIPGMREIGCNAFPSLKTEDIWGSQYFTG